MKFQKIITYVFHPVLFSTIGAVLFFIIQPKYVPKELEYTILSVIFISTYIIPVFFLFILKQKNTIESYHLESINERKFPIIFFVILNLLLGLRLLEFKIISLLAISFIATAIALFFIFLLFYAKIKTSLHTLAIGGITGFLMFLSYHYQIRILILIASIILLFGMVAISRLKLKAHTQIEVFLGFIIGLLTQIFTYYFWFN
ncbi:MAG: hypothetical protein L3J23_09175 [Flavobacteriaceae bacterium]|nr:hypothetical protein [Flavobacteriaceae bacterium]